MFKPGNKVVCNEIIHFLELNKVYEVEAVSRDADGPAFQQLRLKNVPGWFESRKFKEYARRSTTEGSGGTTGESIVINSSPLGDWPIALGTVKVGNTISSTYGEDLKPIEESASKNDQEKIDLSLIPRIALIECAKAFMVGEKKYNRYNYTKGHKSSQLVAAAMRHLMAWNEGEENDPKDGQHHLGSVMACCSMILRQMELQTLKDDRYRK